ncbi:MAG: AEC family transporter [Endomicrobiia bacterium]
MFFGLLLQVILRQNIIKKSISKIIDFNIYISIPFFIFLNTWLYSKTFIIHNPWAILQIIGITFFFIIGGVALSKIHSSIYKIHFNEVSHNIIFMNSLYLGLPVVQFFLGENYNNYVILLAVFLGIIQFTFGIRFFLGEKKFISNLIGLLHIFALVFGIVFSFFELKVSNEVGILSNFLKKIIPPLMLIVVGYRLPIRIKILSGAVLTSVLFRLIGGFLIGILISEIFGFEKEIYCFTLIISSMPPAVNNYIIQEKFKINPEFAAENVFWGTLLSIIFIPLVGFYLRFSGLLP